MSCADDNPVVRAIQRVRHDYTGIMGTKQTDQATASILNSTMSVIVGITQQ